MNIFVLDSDPRIAAQSMGDQHVLKMVIESAQLLSTAHHMMTSGIPSTDRYRPTHPHHPCSIWVREKTGNYMWVLEHAWALADEYYYRYGKARGVRHKTEEVLQRLIELPHDLPPADRTDFVVCASGVPTGTRMSDANAVAEYRNYYLTKKTSMRWQKTRRPPDWWPHPTTQQPQHPPNHK